MLNWISHGPVPSIIVDTFVRRRRMRDISPNWETRPRLWDAIYRETPQHILTVRGGMGHDHSFILDRTMSHRLRRSRGRRGPRESVPGTGPTPVGILAGGK